MVQRFLSLAEMSNTQKHNFLFRFIHVCHSIDVCNGIKWHPSEKPYFVVALGSSTHFPIAAIVCVRWPSASGICWLFSRPLYSSVFVCLEPMYPLNVDRCNTYYRSLTRTQIFILQLRDVNGHASSNGLLLDLWIACNRFCIDGIACT